MAVKSESQFFYDMMLIIYAPKLLIGRLSDVIYLLKS